MSHLIEQFINEVWDLRSAGENLQAINALRQAAKRWPKSRRILSNLAYALLENDQRNESLEVFRRIANVYSEDLEAQSELAEALERVGKSNEALAIYHRLAGNKPMSIGLRVKLGLCLWGLERFDEAQEEYELAIELNQQEQARLFGNLGSLLSDKGDYKGAVEAYEKYVQIANGDSHSYYGLAIALKKLGYIDRAMKARDKFMKLLNLADQMDTELLADFNEEFGEIVPDRS